MKLGPNHGRTLKIRMVFHKKIILVEFNWLSTWSKTHLKKIIEILLPYLIILILIYLIIHFKYKR